MGEKKGEPDGECEGVHVFVQIMEGRVGDVAARRPDPGIEVPLFGSGEIGEDLYLILSGSQTALQ